MVPAILLFSVSLAASSAVAPAAPTDLAAYHAALAGVGRDADAHVRLALWCEARGLNAERDKHLALAVLREPGHATARGLMGLMADRGRWAAPDAVARRMKEDQRRTAALADYNARRAALDAPATDAAKVDRRKLARAHDELGQWCEANDLKPEATAHYTQAVVLDPYREASWRHLGYVKYDGRWMPPDRADAARAEGAAQAKTDREWEPALRKYRSWLSDPRKTDEAHRRLDMVSDPRAVPALRRVLGAGTEAHQRAAAEALGRIDTPASTRALADLAVGSGSDTVRARAAEVLRRREPGDWAPALVQSIRKPMTYRAQPVGGPGSPGALLVECPRYRMLRRYDAPVAAIVPPGGYVGYDVRGMPVIAGRLELVSGGDPGAVLSPWPELRRRGHNKMLDFVEARTQVLIAEAHLKATDSQQRLVADVLAIEADNASAVALNSRAADALRAAADAPSGLKPDDEDGWRTWWFDKVGYRYTPPEQQTLVVDAAPQPAAPFIASCFVAGTPVRTVDGRRPIESLRVGDQVLTQDTSTGALSYQPVLVVHHNPPADCIGLGFEDGEEITASIYYRFFRAGKGWAQARDLSPGDSVRTLGGLSRVTSVVRTGPVPVFNLDVSETRTFFVGRHDLLVHDNTMPDPHVRSFDAAPVSPAIRPE